MNNLDYHNDKLGVHKYAVSWELLTCHRVREAVQGAGCSEYPTESWKSQLGAASYTRRRHEYDPKTLLSAPACLWGTHLAVCWPISGDYD